MSTPYGPGSGGPGYGPRRGRKMSRRGYDAAKKKAQQRFLPDFHGLEKRMMPSLFTVTNTADTGAGSLRQAISDSNLDAIDAPNTIDFDIPTSDPGYRISGNYWAIMPASPLPSISVPVAIDGTSQPGYTSAPLIDIDGTNAGAGVNGLTLTTGSDGSTIEALVISNFTGDGISVTTTANTIVSSYIGTTAAGTAAGASRWPRESW